MLLIHFITCRSKFFHLCWKKYQDFETSPANEPIETTIGRLRQPLTDYYFIMDGNIKIGGIRIAGNESRIYRISPIFILPEFQGKGIAQNVFTQIEQMYPDIKAWQLSTILQEERNMHLYEKLGYKKIGQRMEINDKMSLVFFEKRL